MVPDRTRFSITPAATAACGGLLTGLLQVAAVALIIPIWRLEGAGLVVGLPMLTLPAVLGVVIARRQPRNPVGWILLGSTLSVIVLFDARLYAVLDYRRHGGRLPLGPVAVWLSGSISELLFLLLPLAILLFPDGRLTPRSRWVMRIYVGLIVIYQVTAFLGEAARIAGHHIQVDIKGQFTAREHLTGIRAVLSGLEGANFLLLLVFLVFWVAFVVHQVTSYRSSSDVRRQQLRWLMFGGVVSVTGVVVTFVSSSTNGSAPSLARQAVELVGILMILALPASIGIGVLRYRLYEIDVIIRRTLVYATLVGSLAVAYLSGIFLIDRALQAITGQSGALAVTLSTLAVAAGFQPLRSRIQRAVDHRFYRAKYDAARTLDAFTNRLRDQIELDALSADVLTVVTATLQPRHASLWLRPPDAALVRSTSHLPE